MSEQPDVVVDNDTTALDVEPSVILDEDRLDADPLEDGMDTAEGYSRDVRLGGTREYEERDTLDERIPQEEPDVVAETPPDVPLAQRPALDVDESIDDPANSVDGVGAAIGEDDEVELGLSSAVGDVRASGLAADSGIGEVAVVDNEDPTIGAEQQALHVEQES